MEQYTDTQQGGVRDVLLNLSGGAWSIMNPIEPPGSGSFTEKVTCPSPGWCLIDGGGFLETYSNGVWSYVDTPLPPDAPTGSALAGYCMAALACPIAFSCAAAGSCVAASYYNEYTDPTSSQFAATTEMLTLSNGSWTAVALAQPSDTDLLAVGSIACPQTGKCTAVGEYSEKANSPNAWDVMLSLANGGWSRTNIASHNALVDLSCPSESWCASTGAFIQFGGAATQIALTSSENPGYAGSSVTYTARVTPVPDGGTVSFDNGHSCLDRPVDPITGEATCTVTYGSAGSDLVDASYFGDSNFGESGPTPIFNEDIQQGPPPPPPPPPPTPPFEVALRGSNGTLATDGRDGLTNWGLGIAPRSSPSLMPVASTGYEVAFQANGGALWSVGSAGWTNWGVGMAPGTSPSMVRLSNGGYEIAFQAYGGDLWTIGTAGWTDWHVGMAPNTSPSVVALPNGGFEVAFQAYGGGLWSVGTAGWTNWGVGMAPDTSPSAYAPGSGGYEIAFQAYGGSLWSVGSAGWTNWGVGMAAGTSPSAVRLTNGGYQISFQAYGGAMWSIGTQGWSNWGVGMAQESSPSIAALPNAGYEIAFQAYGGDLWTVGTAGWTDWPAQVAQATSPAAA